MTTQEVDLFVIGGGINGASVYRELALNGVPAHEKTFNEWHGALASTRGLLVAGSPAP